MIKIKEVMGFYKKVKSMCNILIDYGFDIDVKVNAYNITIISTLNIKKKVEVLVDQKDIIINIYFNEILIYEYLNISFKLFKSIIKDL
jgi:hypothetical protein